MKERKTTKFGWAAELEFPIVDALGNPLFVDDLEWTALNKALNAAISTRRSYFAPKYPGHTASPLYLEGFDYYDAAHGSSVEYIKVKGIEIRTDIWEDPRDALIEARHLYSLANKALKQFGHRLAILGCNPTSPRFNGPRGPRDLKSWKAAEVTMGTFGLHVNLSVPHDIERHLDEEKLAKRVNYLAPAMALFSLNSPFLHGDYWYVEGGNIGKSSRAFLRSFYRDPISAKPGFKGTRYHFNLFDMMNSMAHLEAFMQLSMGVLLSKTDVPEVADSTRAYNLSQVAKWGFSERLFDGNGEALMPDTLAMTTLAIAEEGLRSHGILGSKLPLLSKAARQRTLVADSTIEFYERSRSFSQLMSSFSDFYDNEEFGELPTAAHA